MLHSYLFFEVEREIGFDWISLIVLFLVNFKNKAGWESGSGMAEWNQDCLLGSVLHMMSRPSPSKYIVGLSIV